MKKDKAFMQNDKMELYNSRFISACKEGRLEKIKHYIQVKFKNLPEDKLNLLIEKGLLNVIHTFSQKHIESFEYLKNLYPHNIKTIISYQHNLRTDYFFDNLVSFRNFKMLSYLVDNEIINDKKDIESKIEYLVSVKECNLILIKLLNKEAFNWDEIFEKTNLNLLELSCKASNLELVEYIIKNNETDIISNVDYYKNIMPNNFNKELKLQLEQIVKEKEKQIIESSLSLTTTEIKEAKKIKL